MKTAALLAMACALGVVISLETVAVRYAVGAEASPYLLELEGDLDVHDPVIMREGDIYYVFATGGRPGRGIVPVRTSKDLCHWDRDGFAFERLPDWVAQEVPKARNAWAPDIAYFNGKYHLYYSLSSFGVNESAIGLATAKTLDRNSPDYGWVDEGLVVRSRTGVDDFNAIDPNVAVEDESHVWLSWGSFWGGIKMRRLDGATGKPDPADATVYSLAARPRSGAQQTPPTQGAIEAPFIIREGEYWYLFASFDFCCRGAKSDYKVVVGRSNKITGPYVDKAGKPMAEGGGTVILEAATDHWRGAGHNAVLRDQGTDYLVFHAYSATTGRSRLHISTIVWKDGWPEVAKLP